MRAIRVHEWGQAPILDDVPEPVAGLGETLVRVEAAAVAHLDLTVASGRFGIKPELPYVGGVEGCGVVVSSDSLRPGTRVVLRGGGLGLTRPGAWAELVVAKTKTLAPMNQGISAALGATFFVPTTTAHVALHDVARLGGWGLDGVTHPSEEVVIVVGAAGAVGSMVAQLCLREGCTTIGVVASEAQRALVPPGVEAVTSADVDRLDQLAATRPASLVVDTLGGPDLAARSLWCRPGGRAAIIGYVGGTDAALDLPNWLLGDVALLPVNMIRREPAARARASMLADLLSSGDLHLEVETFSLEQAPRALELLASGGLRGRAALLP